LNARGFVDTLPFMLRITAGEFKGRMLRTPNDLKTRPTQAKLRQALFNSIQAYIPDANVLDLFAGSGALGFEALSRGAQKVVFVEAAASVAKWIQKNTEMLGVGDRVQICIGKAETMAEKLTKEGPFDLIFADPPYAGGYEEKLLFHFPWNELLSPSGLFCLEWGPRQANIEELPGAVPFLVKIREKDYGDSRLTTYQLSGENQPTGGTNSDSLS